MLGACEFGDYDCDAAVELDDDAAFTAHMSGAGVPVECPVFDSDGDSDLDLKDAAALQVAFTGGQ